MYEIVPELIDRSPILCDKLISCSHYDLYLGDKRTLTDRHGRKDYARTCIGSKHAKLHVISKSVFVGAALFCAHSDVQLLSTSECIAIAAASAESG